jgi:hypothetical protein
MRGGPAGPDRIQPDWSFDVKSLTKRSSVENVSLGRTSNTHFFLHGVQKTANTVRAELGSFDIFDDC